MTQTNIELSKSQQSKIQQAYADNIRKYGPISNYVLPIIKKTPLDTFQEQHSMKLTHVLIIAGITYMFLSNYQNGEPPFSELVTSG